MTGQYRQIALSLYTLSNSGLLNSAVAATILRSLLTQLAEDALVFFASIWTSHTIDITPALRITALKHALAFINAYKAQGHGIDFQMMVPALVIALQDENKEVRSAAVVLLKAVQGSIGKVEDVYALDTFYGSQSGKSYRMNLSAMEAEKI